MNIAIRNDSGSKLSLILEPLGNSYVVPIDSEVRVVGAFFNSEPDFAEIVFDAEPCISLYVSPDSKVYLGQDELRPIG
ncbi:MAG: hypothetical protein H6924_07100 [Alphaproteobacteria bacterium]|nr:hypothetical protein [Alphaproteobacteria bacterium]